MSDPSRIEVALVLIGFGAALVGPRRWTPVRDGRHRRGAVLERASPLRPIVSATPAVVALAGLGAVTAGPLGAAVGALLGLGVAAGLTVAARRRTTVPHDPMAVALLLDLVGAVLGSGAPPDAALLAVADATLGHEPADAHEPADTVGEGNLAAPANSLRRVGRLLMLGADPDLAWGELAGVPGFGDAAAAARRCATSGARLAAALQRSAHTLRADRQAETAAAAERVGVWSLLPLGLCFLPAFGCLGVLPVVIGVAADVLPGGLP